MFPTDFDYAGVRRSLNDPAVPLSAVIGPDVTTVTVDLNHPLAGQDLTFDRGRVWIHREAHPFRG